MSYVLFNAIQRILFDDNHTDPFNASVFQTERLSYESLGSFVNNYFNEKPDIKS